MKKTINKLTKAGNPTGYWDGSFKSTYYKGVWRYGYFTGYMAEKKNKFKGTYFKKGFFWGYREVDFSPTIKLIFW